MFLCNLSNFKGFFLSAEVFHSLFCVLRADERDVVFDCTLVLAEHVLKTEGWGLCVCFQVDELYEAFCIQSRLREGASRMKQAFSSSPSTKGTKESIAEVNRRYKEYTEVFLGRQHHPRCLQSTTETSVCVKKRSRKVI